MAETVLFSRQSSRQRSGYDALRIVFGLVLIAAAVLKAAQFAVGGLPATGLFSYRIVVAASLGFESAFGLWLLLGLYRGATWRLALVVVAVLALASLAKAVRGDESCGCFGALKSIRG